MRLLLRRTFTTTGGRTVLLVVALVAGWQLWLTAHAPGKMSEGFAAETGHVDAVVTLRFPAERWHILQLQQYGRVTSTRGEELHLRRTTVDELHEVARFHWVVWIEPLDEPSPAQMFDDD